MSSSREGNEEDINREFVQEKMTGIDSDLGILSNVAFGRESSEAHGHSLSNTLKNGHEEKEW